MFLHCIKLSYAYEVIYISPEFLCLLILTFSAYDSKFPECSGV
jgi:hypothetical protein